MPVLSALLLPVLLAQTSAKKPARTAKAPKPAPVTAPSINSAPNSANDSAPFFKCILGLKGTMRTVSQGRDAQGKPDVEQKTESFDYRIPGWIKENSYPQGSVVWEFYPSHEADAKTTGRVDMTIQSGAETVRFISTDPTAYGTFAFYASARGRPVSALATLAITGAAQVTKAGVTTTETRTVTSFPLPNVKKGPKDYTAPTLLFTGSGLWALPNAKSAFDAQASIVFSHSKDSLRADGKVDVTFQLHPELRSATPK
ncbi:MAG: hypothetical protein IPP78_16075 [Holophagaceae bacterium]|nr:hypothetical protein [Holophagaceae bacterium]